MTQLECERRSRSTNLSKMSTVSLDSGHHVVEMADVGEDGINLDAMRKRLRFRHTVSEVSRNTASELSEDDKKHLMDKKHFNASQIVGGRK